MSQDPSERDLETLRHASIGRLVSAIAHELNNPVHIVAGNLDFLAIYLRHLLELVEAHEAGVPAAELAAIRERIEYDYLKTDAPKVVGAVKDAAARLAVLVKDLRTFTRATPDRQRIDLNVVVESALNVLGPLFRNRILVEKRVHGPVPPILGEPGRLHQAILGLLAGAAEALEGHAKLQVILEGTPGGPRLSLRGAFRRSLIDEFSRRILTGHGGKMVEATGDDATVSVTLPASP